jgi:hypothetical protein
MPEQSHIVLVEYEPPPEGADADKMARAIDKCLELRGARWMRSYISLDGKRAVCEFEAPDAESVREAFRMAGQPFDRALVAKRYARE